MPTDWCARARVQDKGADIGSNNLLNNLATESPFFFSIGLLGGAICAWLRRGPVVHVLSGAIARLFLGLFSRFFDRALRLGACANDTRKNGAF